LGYSEARLLERSLTKGLPYTNDLARRTDDPCHEHRYVASARAELYDALARTNPGFAEKPFCERIELGRLSYKTCVLRFGIAQRILL